jgi:hypothetical protein
MLKISTIINYCTNDYRFLRYCVEEAQKFSHQVIIPVCSHFFNGEPENRALLEQSYREHPDVQFIEFAYDEEPYGIYCPLTSSDEDWSHYWHSTARYVGFHYVKNCDYLLFLDVDEIVEADRFIQWLQAFNIGDAVRFSSYFYWGDPSQRAVDRFPLNGLLVRKECIESPEIILDVLERKGLYDQIQGRKLTEVVGLDGRPLVHHYSWVRTPEELRQKVRTWGHRHDQDWLKLIEKPSEIFGFTYERIDPVHHVLQKISLNEGAEISVEKVNRKSFFEVAIRQMLL